MAEKPKTNPTTSRRTLLMLGGFLIAFSLYLMVFLVPDVLRTAGGPQSVTLEQAAAIANTESAYVTIEDGEWDCRTIEYVRGRSSTNSRRIETRFTEIFLTDGANPDQIVLFASMSGEMTCDDFEILDQPTGYLTRMSDGKQQELTNDARLARYFDATDFLEFCGYCGTENSLIGAIVGVVLFLGGLFVFWRGWKMPKA